MQITLSCAIDPSITPHVISQEFFSRVTVFLVRCRCN
ncbi:hypothetical protein RJ641_018489 [Dillenia turbinata]|uniref:Uncharacterized protein n=1 Tax=Dillenia turbinata TaxID=194707 RepID=A0AAN8UJ47_9MAGN